jgi:uncharacterized protein YecT (DUF1311 family)
MLRHARKLLAAGALVLVTAPPAARAQGDCRSALTQGEMTACSASAARAAERRLARLLAELYPQLDSARAADLREQQVMWKRFRDRYCRWDADSYRGGSVWPMWYADCVGLLTNQRIDQLRFHLCDDDAGMGGECPASLRYDPYPPGHRRRPEP